MNNRLTTETARVGMRVEAVETTAYSFNNIVSGNVYTIVEVGTRATVRLRETGPHWFCADHFIPADPRPVPLPAMWCGADAFTQENSDAD